MCVFIFSINPTQNIFTHTTICLSSIKKDKIFLKCSEISTTSISVSNYPFTKRRFTMMNLFEKGIYCSITVDLLVEQQFWVTTFNSWQQTESQPLLILSKNSYRIENYWISDNNHISIAVYLQQFRVGTYNPLIILHFALLRWNIINYGKYKFSKSISRYIF